MKATQEEYHYIFILICHTINRFQREVYFLGNQLGSHHEGSGGKKSKTDIDCKWTKIDSYRSIILISRVLDNPDSVFYRHNLVF